MSQERLWPADNDGVIREIIPGGHAEREYLLYPNAASARMVQRLEGSRFNRFIPKILIALVDDGMPVDGSCLEHYTAGIQDGSASLETASSDPITDWYESQQEVRHHAA